jgi:hypothetical protein
MDPPDGSYLSIKSGKGYKQSKLCSQHMVTHLYAVVSSRMDCRGGSSLRRAASVSSASCVYVRGQAGCVWMLSKVAGQHAQCEFLCLLLRLLGCCWAGNNG